MAVSGLDIAAYAGRTDRASFVFVHGLGMNRHIWTDPRKARIMGGLLPLDVLLKDYGELKTLYHDLRGMGLSVIAWSQTRPVGPPEVSVSELLRVTHLARAMGNGDVVYICHSRGGLILRLALPRITGLRAMVTMCTPHRGTGMAKWAEFASPLASFLRQYIPEEEKDGLTRAIKRSVDFIGSRAVTDLLPDSPFMQSLNNNKPLGAYCISAGGTDPALIKLSGRLGGLISVQEALMKALPGSIMPKEMRQGEGDGLVSAESARLAYADEHMDFAVNHAEIIVDPGVRGAILKKLVRALAL